MSKNDHSLFFLFSETSQTPPKIMLTNLNRGLEFKRRGGGILLLQEKKDQESKYKKLLDEKKIDFFLLIF